MTKLADMKMTKSEKKDSGPMSVGKYEGPDYPYGLTLRLDNASLEKLGIETLPKVGATMQINAMGVVTSVSSHESKNRDERTVEIQIQKLAVEDDDDDSEDSPLERIVRKRA
jgi:hypothetical protein